MNFKKSKSLLFTALSTTLGLALCAPAASAEVSFVSATNGVTLNDTFVEGEEKIFILENLADGASSDLTFSTDTDCPGVAMTGGAEFISAWSCSEGTISASVTYRGGLTFGPDGPPNTFYVTFSGLPTPPGLDSPPTELAGIQLSVFGDIRSWDLDGNISSSGATFGVELSGQTGGEAHFRMGIPAPAVTYLGGVLGVYVGGRPDPFATVTTNEDGSVNLRVDIENLSSTSTILSRAGSNTPTFVTKRITAGERVTGLKFNRTTVKKGRAAVIAMCAGTQFTPGNRVTVQFTTNGASAGIRKVLTLNSKGCARSTMTVNPLRIGTLKAKVTYKRRSASTTIKVTK